MFLSHQATASITFAIRENPLPKKASKPADPPHPKAPPAWLGPKPSGCKSEAPAEVGHSNPPASSLLPKALMATPQPSLRSRRPSVSAESKNCPPPEAGLPKSAAKKFRPQEESNFADSYFEHSKPFDLVATNAGRSLYRSHPPTRRISLAIHTPAFSTSGEMFRSECSGSMRHGLIFGLERIKTCAVCHAFPCYRD